MQTISKEARLTALVIEGTNLGHSGCALQRAWYASGKSDIYNTVHVAFTLGFTYGEVWGIMDGWDDSRNPRPLHSPDVSREIARDQEAYDRAHVLGAKLRKLV